MDEETKYPSVDLAYDLAVKSYDTIQQRWDAMNSLFHSLLSVVITLTLAIPLLSKALGLPIGAHWTNAALWTFALNVLLCLSGRLLGSFKTLSPGSLYKHHLGSSHWEFKKMLYILLACTLTGTLGSSK